MAFGEVVHITEKLLPKKGGPRDTVSILIAIGLVAVLAIGVWIVALRALDTRIRTRTLPLKYKVYESAALIEQLYDDAETDRVKKGGEKRDRQRLMERARKQARESEEE